MSINPSNEPHDRPKEPSVQLDCAVPGKTRRTSGQILLAAALLSVLSACKKEEVPQISSFPFLQVHEELFLGDKDQGRSWEASTYLIDFLKANYSDFELVGVHSIHYKMDPVEVSERFLSHLGPGWTALENLPSHDGVGFGESWINIYENGRYFLAYSILQPEYYLGVERGPTTPLEVQVFTNANLIYE